MRSCVSPIGSLSGPLGRGLVFFHHRMLWHICFISSSLEFGPKKAVRREPIQSVLQTSHASLVNFALNSPTSPPPRTQPVPYGGSVSTKSTEPICGKISLQSP